MAKKKTKKHPQKKAPKRRRLSAHNVSISHRARKVVRAGLAEILDRSLLQIAADQYSRLLQEVERRRKRLDKDRKAALEMGERILERAKAVSASLVRK
jgi:hypothetical protein